MYTEKELAREIEVRQQPPLTNPPLLPRQFTLTFEKASEGGGTDDRRGHRETSHVAENSVPWMEHPRRRVGGLESGFLEEPKQAALDTSFSGTNIQTSSEAVNWLAAVEGDSGLQAA